MRTLFLSFGALLFASSLNAQCEFKPNVPIAQAQRHYRRCFPNVQTTSAVTDSFSLSSFNYLANRFGDSIEVAEWYADTAFLGFESQHCTVLLLKKNGQFVGDVFIIVSEKFNELLMLRLSQNMNVQMPDGTSSALPTDEFERRNQQLMRELEMESRNFMPRLLTTFGMNTTVQPEMRQSPNHAMVYIRPQLNLNVQNYTLRFIEHGGIIFVERCAIGRPSFLEAMYTEFDRNQANESTR